MERSDAERHSGVKKGTNDAIPLREEHSEINDEHVHPATMRNATQSVGHTEHRRANDTKGESERGVRSDQVESRASSSSKKLLGKSASEGPGSTPTSKNRSITSDKVAGPERVGGVKHGGEASNGSYTDVKSAVSVARPSEASRSASVTAAPASKPSGTAAPRLQHTTVRTLVRTRVPDTGAPLTHMAVSRGERESTRAPTTAHRRENVTKSSGATERPQQPTHSTSPFDHWKNPAKWTPRQISMVEKDVDYLLAGSFLLVFLVALIAMCRYCTSRRASRGTGFFFFLIAVSALLRAVWLGVPNQFFSEGYAPKPIVIGQARWREMIIGEGLESVGTLFLYSIFVLVITHWAAILRRSYGGSEKRRPMGAFCCLFFLLLAAESAIFASFFILSKSSFFLLAANAIFRAVLAFCCFISISIYSYRLRTILQALADVRRMQTHQRAKNIYRTTVLCNLFFLGNMASELYICVSYYKLGTVDAFLGERWWWAYVFVKHAFEIVILLALLLSLWSSSEGRVSEGYEEIPDSLGSSSEEEEEYSPTSYSPSASAPIRRYREGGGNNY